MCQTPPEKRLWCIRLPLKSDVQHKITSNRLRPYGIAFAVTRREGQPEDFLMSDLFKWHDTTCFWQRSLFGNLSLWTILQSLAEEHPRGQREIGSFMGSILWFLILECVHVIPSFFIAGDVALVHCTTWYTPGRRHRPQPGPDCLHGQPRGARLRRGRPSLKAQTHGAPVDLPASHIYDLGIRGATGGRGAPYRVHASRDAARLRGRCLMHADLLMHVKPSTTPQVVLPCQTSNLIAESWQKESFSRMMPGSVDLR